MKEKKMIGTSGETCKMCHQKYKIIETKNKIKYLCCCNDKSQRDCGKCGDLQTCEVFHSDKNLSKL